MWLNKFYSLTLSFALLKEKNIQCSLKSHMKLTKTTNFRALEDFVTWVDTSKVRQHVMEYQDLRDDYEVHC